MTIDEVIPWYGAGLIVAIVIAVRYVLRPLLARRWPALARDPAVAYFVLFVATLAVTGVVLLAGDRKAGENAAMACYYVFLVGSVIAFVSSGRAAKEAAPMQVELPTESSHESTR